jgi:hypothetical protein
MNERVLNLLSLCLTAKEQGVLIWFDFAPHCDAVSIYAFKEGWETTLPDEEAERYFTYHIYLNWEDAEEKITTAEQAIRDLIKERGKRI